MRRSAPAYPLALAVLLGACSTPGEESLPQTGPDPTAATVTEDPAGAGEGAATEPDGDATATSTTGDDAAATTGPGAAGAATGAAEQPGLEVETMASGLAVPWDVQHLPDGTAVVSEREGRILTIPMSGDGEAQEVEVEIPDLFAGSEAGLMGLAVSPDFEEDNTVLACYATESGGTPQDVRVVQVVMDEDLTGAEVGEVVIEGMPITTGRHAGCRLLIDGDTLYVGTGDAADESNPQDLSSLGGKVLATTLDGEPLPEAPFVEGDPRIFSYGHRNVQGLAVHPDTGDIWAVEHGPDVDDEVNVLVPGGNYGWDPGPGYDENVPMTDTETYPDAIEAVYSTGDPTQAMSGAVFVLGEQWGAWDGSLAVAELANMGVTVLTFDGTELLAEERMDELEGAARLRSLTLHDDGSLWVTTSDGEDDRVLRVTAGPAG